jgi:hypothetical protein
MPPFLFRRSCEDVKDGKYAEGVELKNMFDPFDVSP